MSQWSYPLRQDEQWLPLRASLAVRTRANPGSGGKFSGREAAEGWRGAAEAIGQRAIGAGNLDYQLSPNGRASTSKLHALRSWRVSWNAVSATADGWTKKLSSLSAIAWRVRGRSTTPSMMTRHTWMPDG